MKIIWYCHHYAGAPSVGMSYRPYYFTREFMSRGHNAFVIASSFHHLAKPNLQKLRVPVCKVEHDDVPFIYLKNIIYRNNSIKRILNMLIYAWRIRFYHKKIVTITGKPDVIICSSSHPFHYPVLERLAKKYKAKLVFEVRDLWPLSLIELMGMTVCNPLVKYLAHIEKRAYKNADIVVSSLKHAFNYMQHYGLDEKRFVYIANGVDIKDEPQDLSKQLLEKIIALKQKGNFLLGYAGAMGTPNALSYLIDALKLIQDKGLSVHCILVGEGSLRDKLEQQIKENQLKNVTMLSSIAKTQIPSFLKQMDALYLGWNKVDLYKYGVSPNKLYDYLLSGKPIIESGGDSEGIVATNKVGVYCRAANPKAIAIAIEQTYNLSACECKEIYKKSLVIIKSFDYKKLAQKYLSLFC